MREQEVKLFSLNQSHLALKVMLLQSQDPWILLLTLHLGVERELQHAWEHTKEVYVVWKPRKAPSPFITETATKIFPTVDAALAYFEAKGMFHPGDLFGR